MVCAMQIRRISSDESHCTYKQPILRTEHSVLVQAITHSQSYCTIPWYLDASQKIAIQPTILWYPIKSVTSMPMHSPPTSTDWCPRITNSFARNLISQTNMREKLTKMKKKKQKQNISKQNTQYDWNIISWFFVRYKQTCTFFFLFPILLRL